MPYKDPEKRKASDAARYQKNREKRLEQNKAYYETHKKEIQEQHKSNYDTHKEDRKEKNKIWHQTPTAKKSQTLANWKRYGLIHKNYEQLYDTYLEATHCNACKSEFKDSSDRCMDHDHETNLFRQFLCRSCNTGDSWLKYQTSS